MIPSLTLWPCGDDKSIIRRQQSGLPFLGMTPSGLGGGWAKMSVPLSEDDGKL